MDQSHINGFKDFLQLEKSLQPHSVDAYIRDVEKLYAFLSTHPQINSLKHISLSLLEAFITELASLGLSSKSQARIVSGIRAFFKYCLIENIIQDNPAAMLEIPKYIRKLPDVLNFEEIESIIAQVDLSSIGGERDKAILELMYSSGLRVSEVINLRISWLYLDIDFIKIIGKGNKQRLVPIGNSAKKQLLIYLHHVRHHQKIDPSCEDIVFLNSRRGKALTRAYVFKMIKNYSQLAGIKKNVSPHTFRHSFATHLIEGGADLRSIQEMLGHESITTTEIYTHLDRSFLHQTLQQYHPAFQKKDD